MSNAVSLRPPKYHGHKAMSLAVVAIKGRNVSFGRYCSGGL